MCKLMRKERFIMQMQVKDLKPYEAYNRIYSSQNDVSELAELIRNNTDSYIPIVIDEDRNIIVGIDTWRALKQISPDGTISVRVCEQSFSSEDEKVLTMIQNYNHKGASTEELCRATYAYYESYRKCYSKGHELYLTSKQLYAILPKIFKIKKTSDPTKALSGKCYEDYISVGRKIHELEEQNEYDNLECLLIQLENISPLTMRHDGLLSQIYEWTDEIRAEIRKLGREKGISVNVISRIVKEKKIQKTDSSDKTTVTNEPIDVVADLWDEERDRSMNSYDLLNNTYETIASCYNSVRSMIEYESETEVTPKAREKGYEVLCLLGEITEYITKRFCL